MEKDKKIKELLSKLRSPLGVDFISKNIFNLSEFETKEILEELIQEGIVDKENNYYFLKKDKNEN